MRNKAEHNNKNRLFKVITTSVPEIAEARVFIFGLPTFSELYGSNVNTA